MRILIINNNKNITNMLSKYIKLKGSEVKVVNEGKKGFELLEKESFDVILLDITIPEFSRYNIINFLEKSGKIKESKVIVLTASRLQEKTDDLIKKGVNTVLKKPILLSNLIDVLTS